MHRKITKTFISYLELKKKFCLALKNRYKSHYSNSLKSISFNLNFITIVDNSINL